MKVLVLCGDYWHPAEVIRRGLSYLNETGAEKYEFDFVEDAKDLLTPEYISQYPVIINAKMDEITGGNQNPWFEKGVTEVQPADLQAYVEKGGGFIALHAGNSYFADKTPEYVDFVGNAFVRHPARCDVKIKIVEENPITEGVTDFVVRDEHYEIDHLASDRKTFMMSESATGGLQTAGYIREIGEGRLCVLTPGHILSVYTHPEFQKLLCNAIAWCAGEK